MSKKILILAEKPSLGRDIAAALGVTQTNSHGHHENSEFIIAPLSGHLLAAKYDLPEYTKENLPIKGLESPTMVTKKESDYIKSRVKSVLAELKRDDLKEIVSAGDADQEGSLLIYEMLEYTKVLDKTKITRMWIHAVDAKTLKKAFEERYDIEEDLSYVEAAKARSLADARVGYNFSRLFSMKGNCKTSVGRVRTALMQIVRHRELEIENFKPEPYYNIKGDFSEGLQADLVMQAENEEEGKETQTTRISEAYYKDFVAHHLTKGSGFVVAEVSKEAKKTYPDLLPNQNDILKNVGKLHNAKTAKIVEAMQSLYEKQFISYPRSEKRHLPVSLYEKMEEVFGSLVENYQEEIGGAEISIDAANKRVFDDAKVEEHFAVVPWMPKTKSEIEKLPELERQTYEYVVAKFLMACMKPYEYDSSTIVLAGPEGLTFKAVGKIETAKGFRSYNYQTNKASKDVVLPEVKQDQKLELLDWSEKREMTKPPALLDEPALLDIMENVNKLYKKQVASDEEDYYAEKFSLGTPATRSGILEQVIKVYKYVTVNKKNRLETTPEGKKLLDIVGGAIDLQMTAYFEREMQKIQKDKEYARIFNEMMEEYVNSVIDKVLPDLPDTPQNTKKEIDHVCPLCGEPILETEKTFKCSKNIYKDGKQSGCKFSLFKDQTKFFGRVLNENDLDTLLGSSKDAPMKGEKGAIYFDPSNKYFISAVFPEAKEGEFVETAKTFRIGDKFVFKNIRGKDLTKTEAKKLLDGEQITLKRKSKAGKEYQILTKLSAENNGQVDTEMAPKG